MNADAAISIWHHNSPKGQKYTHANSLCIHMTRNSQIHTCVNVNILLHLIRPRCIFTRVQRTTCIKGQKWPPWELLFLAYPTRFAAIFTSADKPYLTYPYPTRGINKK